MANDQEGDRETVAVNISKEGLDELRDLYPHALNDSERLRMAMHDARRLEKQFDQRDDLRSNSTNTNRDQGLSQEKVHGRQGLEAARTVGSRARKSPGSKGSNAPRREPETSMPTSSSNSISSFASAADLGRERDDDPDWTVQEEATYDALRNAEAAHSALGDLASVVTGNEGEVPPEARETALRAYAALENAAKYCEEILEETRTDSPARCPECGGKGRFDPTAGKPSGAATVEISDPVPVRCKECGERWVMGREESE